MRAQTVYLRIFMADLHVFIRWDNSVCYDAQIMNSSHSSKHSDSGSVQTGIPYRWEDHFHTAAMLLSQYSYHIRYTTVQCIEKYFHYNYYVLISLHCLLHHRTSGCLFSETVLFNEPIRSHSGMRRRLFFPPRNERIYRLPVAVACLHKHLFIKDKTCDCKWLTETNLPANRATQCYDHAQIKLPFYCSQSWPFNNVHSHWSTVTKLGFDWTLRSKTLTSVTASETVWQPPWAVWANPQLIMQRLIPPVFRKRQGAS